MRKIFTIFIAFSLLIGLLVFPVSAEATSGVCGENLTWSISATELPGQYQLTISGTGPMYNYSEDNPAPWSSRKGFYKLVIENGVTTVGNYAFYNRIGALAATFPATLTHIGEKAFYGTPGSRTFLGGTVEIAPDAFGKAYGDCRYLFGWDETAMQTYGGEYTWKKGIPTVMPETKTVYSPGEEIKASDFVLQYMFTGQWFLRYTPEEIRTEAYDNTVCGEKKVNVTIGDFTFTHTYWVADDTGHFDHIVIDMPPTQIYTGKNIEVLPVVTAGSLTLTKDVHYTLSYQNNINIGTDASVTVTGIGEFEGFSRTVYFAILKQDLANAGLNQSKTLFCGMPTQAALSVYASNLILTEGTDYVVYGENNVNIGTATNYVIGIGNYCGYQTGTFEIVRQVFTPTQKTLKGTYIGQANGELSEDTYYSEMLLSPASYVFRIKDTVVDSTALNHYALYQLYKVVDEELILITTYEPNLSEPGHREETEFAYDFSSVYEGATEEGGEIYLLSYAWIDSTYAVYSGTCLLLIPAKVPDATQLDIAQLQDDGDFRRVYLNAYGVDGHSGNMAWSVSDSSVATVKDGAVTLLKPGTVTVTAQWGSLSVSQKITTEALDISQATLLRYDSKTGNTYVYYDGFLLNAYTDYTVSVSRKESSTEVTVTGTGLFTGQLVQTIADQEHNHTYTSPCDTTCNNCTHIRQVNQAHTPRAFWAKDEVAHWHICSICGETSDYELHTIDPQHPDLCTVCDVLYTPGDLNSDTQVDNKDVEYLLWYTLFPEDYPLPGSGDFNGDNQVNNKDVEYLLWYTLFPEDYPLPGTKK